MRFGDYVNADGEAEQHISGICGDMPRAVLRIWNAELINRRQLHAHDSCGERMRFGDYVNADGEPEQHNFVVSNDMPRTVLCIRNADLDSSGQLLAHGSCGERMRFGDYVSADGEAEQHRNVVSGDMRGAVLCLRDTDPDCSRELYAHHSSGERLRFGDSVNVDGKAEQHSVVVNNDMPRTVLRLWKSALDDCRQLLAYNSCLERL
ncbi:MAG: hypothetical protein EBS08_06285 [Cytophagia bacterium]|nr:hypothetical protein [Cytophagia bacterium]